MVGVNIFLNNYNIIDMIKIVIWKLESIMVTLKLMYIKMNYKKNR